MRPKHRNRRLVSFSIFASIAILGSYLLVSALKGNTQFFHNPSGVLATGFEAKSSLIRVGGLVVDESISKPGGLTTTFIVRDFENPNALEDELSVIYTGVLPDLFREGEGVVLTGSYTGEKFVATEVLAKHDNEYRPKLPESGS